MGILGLILGPMGWNVDGVTFFKGAFGFFMLYYYLKGLEMYKTKSPVAFWKPSSFPEAL